MATITKRPTSNPKVFRHRAEVFVRGVRRSRTFRTKPEAAAWALLQESELAKGGLPSKTLGDAMERYAAEVSPKHKGERWEVVRLAKMRREWAASKLPLAQLGTDDIVKWRDNRLTQVGPASTLRELAVLRAVLVVARRDWKWLHENPIQGMTLPTAPPARRRRVSDDVITAMLGALNYKLPNAPVTKSQRIALAMLFALETACRSGEITGLTWADVTPFSVRLAATKNGDVRLVPLSEKARAILALLPRDKPFVFGMNSADRDALFRKARIALIAKSADKPKLAEAIGDLHFHDLRSEAIWRLSKKLDVLELARMIGHRDINSLMMYYNATPEELAAKLG